MYVSMFVCVRERDNIGHAPVYPVINVASDALQAVPPPGWQQNDIIWSSGFDQSSCIDGCFPSIQCKPCLCSHQIPAALSKPALSGVALARNLAIATSVCQLRPLVPVPCSKPISWPHLLSNSVSQPHPLKQLTCPAHCRLAKPTHPKYWPRPLSQSVHQPHPPCHSTVRFIALVLQA